MQAPHKIFRPIYLPLVNWYYEKYQAPKRYSNLYQEIKKLKAKSILEVGTWNGRRALKMIDVAKHSSSEPVTYVGFDLFEGLTDEMYKYEISKKPPTKKQVEDLLNTTGANIKLVKGNTLETLPNYLETNDTKFDFIFIDGGHHVETVKSDWQCVSKLMHKDTVVIFDDYWHHRMDQSAKPVVNAIDKHLYNIEILPEIDIFNHPDFGRLEISFAKVTLKDK